MDDESASNRRVRELIAKSEALLGMMSADDDFEEEGDERSHYSPQAVQALVDTNKMLKRMVAEKRALCKKLEGTVERLLKMQEHGSFGMPQNLSQAYFKHQFKGTRSQLWFENQVPPAVDGALEKLADKLPDFYVDRDKSLTILECFNMVDEVRNEWEREIPPLIQKALTVRNHVYPSHACAKEDVKGRPCEAVHFLIYMVYKLFNRAPQVLVRCRRVRNANSATCSIVTPLEDRKEGTVEVVDVTDASGRVKEKWRDNPSFSLAVQKARSAVNAFRFDGQAALEMALDSTVTKLAFGNKPKLEETLGYLASIIALNEVAVTRGWEVERQHFAHREIFQFKMLEYWQVTGYTGDWETFRTDLFKAMNCMIIFMFMCDERRKAAMLIQRLSGMTRNMLRKELERSLQIVIKSGNPEPLWNALNIVAPTPEYALFYSRAFVVLLDFVGIIESNSMPETVLLHLIHDLRITPLPNLSALERNDYVKVISILISTMLEPVTKQYDVPEEEGEERRHYCEAAVYLGSKLRCIMKRDQLTVEEEQSFWTKSTIDGYMGLQEYCSDINQWRHILPRVLLPKWSSDPAANASPPSVDQYFPLSMSVTPVIQKASVYRERQEATPVAPVVMITSPSNADHCSASAGARFPPNISGMISQERSPATCSRILPNLSGVGCQDGSASSGTCVPVDVAGVGHQDTTKLEAKPVVKSGMKVAEMRHLLQTAGLNVNGKKAELKRRLIEEGGFTEDLRGVKKIRRSTRGKKTKTQLRTINVGDHLEACRDVSHGYHQPDSEAEGSSDSEDSDWK